MRVRRRDVGGYAVVELIVAAALLMVAMLLASQILLESQIEMQQRTVELSNPSPRSSAIWAERSCSTFCMRSSRSSSASRHWRLKSTRPGMIDAALGWTETWPIVQTVAGVTISANCWLISVEN